MGEHEHLEKARGRAKYNGRSVNQLQDPLEGGPRLSAAATRNLAAQPRASGGGDAVSKGSVLRLEPSAQRAGGDRAVLLPTAGLGLPGLRAPFLKSQACAVGRGC